MLATGIDIIEISRVRACLKKFGTRFLQRVYTEAEASLYQKRSNDLAARFAAKEAVMKALGTGAKGVSWREIEILPDPRGKPLVYLHGRAKKRAAELELSSLDVSLSHSKELAVAIAVGITTAEAKEYREDARNLLLALLQAQGKLKNN